MFWCTKLRLAGQVIDEWKLLKSRPSSVFAETKPVEPALGYHGQTVILVSLPTRRIWRSGTVSMRSFSTVRVTVGTKS